MLLRFLTIISISAPLSAFSIAPLSSFLCRVEADSVPSDSVVQHTIGVSELLQIAESLVGTPYKYGSQSSSGFDCSGYVRHCFSTLAIDLPHSSSAQSNIGEKVKLKNVQPGDLLFFKGRSTRKKTVGHVAIVHSIDSSGKIFMIHASTSRGVIIECLDDSAYFTKRFVVAKRIV